MTTVSGSSQSDIGDIHPATLVKQFYQVIFTCHNVGKVLSQWVILLCHHSLHDLIHTLLIKVHCHTGFPASSWGYTSPLICPKVLVGINTYWHILTWPYWLWCVEWQCSHWEHMVTCSVVMKFICVGAFLHLWLLVYLKSCCYCYFYIHITSGVLCTYSTGLSSSQLWFHWYLMHLACWIWHCSSPWLTHIPQWHYIFPWSIPHHLPLCTSMSRHAIFQLPTVETIHYSTVTGTFHWNPKHARSVIYFNRRSLTWCKLSSRSSYRPCSKQVKTGLCEYLKKWWNIAWTVPF